MLGTTSFLHKNTSNNMTINSRDVDFYIEEIKKFQSIFVFLEMKHDSKKTWRPLGYDLLTGLLGSENPYKFYENMTKNNKLKFQEQYCLMRQLVIESNLLMEYNDTFH